MHVIAWGVADINLLLVGPALRQACLKALTSQFHCIVLRASINPTTVLEMLACRSLATASRLCLTGKNAPQQWIPSITKVKSKCRILGLELIGIWQSQSRTYVAEKDKVAKFKGQKGSDV